MHARNRTRRRLVIIATLALLPAAIVCGWVGLDFAFEMWWLQALESGEAPRIRGAVNALGERGSSRAVPKLVSLAMEPMEGVPAVEVVEALARIGIQGIDPLIVASRAEERQPVFHVFDRLEAAKEAGHLTKNEIDDVLLPLLRHADFATRMEAIYVLRERCRISPGFVFTETLRLLDDTDQRVRRVAVEDLSACHSHIPEKVEVLAGLVSDDDTSVKQIAAYNVGELARQLPPGHQSRRRAVTTLLNILVTDSDNRRAAANALGTLETDAVDAIPALVDCLRDPAPETRRQTAQALSAIANNDSTAVVQALSASLDDSDPYVREAVARALDTLRQK